MPWVKVSESPVPESTSELIALINRAIAAQVAWLGLRSWHESTEFAHLDGVSTVPNLTGGQWPSMCNDRRDFPVVTRGPAYGVWCTRPTGHTGRHAAGRCGRVVAVWATGAEVRL